MGAKNPNFTCRMMGVGRAAVLQERNTGTAIQEHGFNIWQQQKLVNRVSEITGKRKGNLLCPFKSMGQPYTEVAAAWSTPEVMTKGLQLLSRLGLTSYPGAVGTEGGTWS